MKVGLQVSSLKMFLQTPQGVLETFKKIKAIGYNYIQIQWINDDVPMESIKESLDAAGLICTGAQESFANVFDYTETFIEKNKLWQGKYICASLTVPSAKPELLEAAERLNTISKKLNEKELILEIHPLFGSYIKTGGNDTGAMPLDTLWEHLDGGILLQPDFYHVVSGKADPVGIIEKYGGRIDEVHFKDFRIPENNPGAAKVTPVGQGIIPWKEIAESCIKHGVKYCFAEQESWDKDAFECMKDSWDYLTGIGLLP